MTERIDVGPLMPQDLQELNAFYREHLDHGERLIQLYGWWAANPQESSRVHTFVVKIDGRIAGTLNAIPIELALRQERLAAAWQQNSIVAPSARNTGIGKLLVERAAEDWQVLLAKGTSTPMYRLRKTVGFRDVPNASYLAHFIHPWGLDGSGLRRVAGLVYWAGSQGRVWKFRRRTPGGERAVTVAEVTHLSAELREAALGTFGAVTLIKQLPYLQWRYGACPGRTYTFIVARRAGRCVGLLVLRLPRNTHEPAWLVDLRGDPTDRDSVDVLLSAGVERSRAAGAASLRTFATLPAFRARLHRAGFLDLPSTPHFTFRTRDPELAAALEAEDWDFWHGDGDVELY